MRECELQAKAQISALHAELKGLSRAFADRHRLIQSYKVTQIVIELKCNKVNQLGGENSVQIQQLNDDISELE